MKSIASAFDRVERLGRIAEHRAPVRVRPPGRALEHQPAPVALGERHVGRVVARAAPPGPPRVAQEVERREMRQLDAPRERSASSRCPPSVRNISSPICGRACRYFACIVVDPLGSWMPRKVPQIRAGRGKPVCGIVATDRNACREFNGLPARRSTPSVPPAPENRTMGTVAEAPRSTTQGPGDAAAHPRRRRGRRSSPRASTPPRSRRSSPAPRSPAAASSTTSPTRTRSPARCSSATSSRTARCSTASSAAPPSSATTRCTRS